MGNVEVGMVKPTDVEMWRGAEGRKEVHLLLKYMHVGRVQVGRVDPEGVEVGARA